MSHPDNAAVLALVDAMKARGVRTFSAHGVSVEFGPAEVALKSDGARVDADACACGHDYAAHSPMGCTMGCDLEKCAPKETK